MRELLRYEFHKLFRARVLYVCAMVLVLLLVFFAGIDKLTELGLESLGVSMSENEADPASLELINMMGMGFGTNTGLVRMLTALTNIYLPIVFGAFIAVFVCSDYGNGIAKNVLTKGYSREEMFFAKYITSLAASLAFALLAFLIGFLTGTVFWKVGSGWSAKVILLLLLQLLTVIAFNAFYNFLASWLKKVPGTLILSIAIPVFLPMVLTLVELFLNDGTNISMYWLGGCFALASTVNAAAADMALSAIISAAYLAVFTVLGWLLSKTREV